MHLNALYIHIHAYAGIFIHNDAYAYTIHFVAAVWGMPERVCKKVWLFSASGHTLLGSGGLCSCQSIAMYGHAAPKLGSCI